MLTRMNENLEKSVPELIAGEKTSFSFEILPPLKGHSIEKVYHIIDKLREFNPQYINITTHHSENIFKELPNGNIQKINVRKRPGSVAIAAAIQYKYGIPAIPHIICKGFSREETEYALIDLNFLGVYNLLLLRGDIHKHGPSITTPVNQHATDLQEQVNLFNKGISANDEPFEPFEIPFKYGMACYPEKHEEAPNLEADIAFAKKKQDMGAEYLVTQMFFDNKKYFDFVKLCRKSGITIPIIPGIKPIVSKAQLNILPRVFSLDIPQSLAKELARCKDDEQAKRLGIEWGIMQCKELIQKGVPSIHFYSLMASESIKHIAQEVY